MASKTTKVVTQIAAEVTGTEDITQLADQIAQVPDDTKPKVAAKVTGDADVAGLARQLDQLPASTDPKVAATVTGTADVAGLAQDLAGLPDSTGSKVTASVAGDQAVDTLASDLDRLPATTDAKVAATVSGDQRVDALVAKLQSVPESQTFTVTANIKETGQKGGLKQVGHDIDEVKGKAGKLGVEGGAFAAQFLGPFSDSIGLFGDLGEQLSNLGDEAGEAGAGGKLKALGKVGAGVGLAIVGGLLVDTIISDFQKIGAAQAEVAGVTQSLTQTLIDNGDAWDENAQRALIAQVSQTTAFKDLSAAGIDYATIMDGLTGQAGGMEKLAAAAIASGNKAAVESLKEAQGLSKVGANSRAAAKDALDYAKARGLLTDAQKDGLAASGKDAAGMKDTGKAATDSAGKVDTATSSAKGYNAVTIDPKVLEIQADKTAADKVLTQLHDVKLADKVQRIIGNGKSVTDKIAQLKALGIPPKYAQIIAEAQNTAEAQAEIQKVADADYTATLWLKLKAFNDQVTKSLFGWMGIGTSSVAPPSSDPEGLAAADTPAARGSVAVAAPTVTATLPVAAAPVALYQITIQGAIDKDGTARQIDKILRGRARRVGATQLGRRPV